MRVRVRVRVRVRGGGGVARCVCVAWWHRVCPGVRACLECVRAWSVCVLVCVWQVAMATAATRPPALPLRSHLQLHCLEQLGGVRELHLAIADRLASCATDLVVELTEPAANQLAQLDELLLIPSKERRARHRWPIFGPRVEKDSVSMY